VQTYNTIQTKSTIGYMYIKAGGQTIMELDVRDLGAGSVYSGSTVTVYKLYYHSLSSVSLSEFKTDIRDLKTEALPIIRKPPVKRFKWKVSGKEGIGLIAEECEKVCKDLVSYDSRVGLREQI